MTGPRFSCERICFVLLSGLGDVVHGLPLVNALKAGALRSRITWVVEPMPSALLAPHPSVDEVIVFDKARGVRGVRDLWRVMRQRRFDLALNLNIYFKSVFPTVFSRAPHRVGIDRARARDGVWLFTNHHLPPRPRAHTQDLFLEFLDFLGVAESELSWRIAITDEERAAQAAFFESMEGRPVAAIVPASAHSSKDWFADRQALLADALEADFGSRVLLVGGPGEREQRIAREIREHSRARVVWGLGDGVRPLIWRIAGSQIVIAPDTGPVHIARALDVPVIGLYGATNPWRVGPYRKFEDLWVDRYTLEGEEPSPHRLELRLGRMDLITVQDVLARVHRAVKRYLRTPLSPPDPRM